MQLQARDKRALIGGAIVVTGLLAVLLWPSAPDGANVELVPAAERGAAPAPVTPPSPAPVAPAPVQPAVAPQAGTQAQPPASPGSVPEGLKLTGVTATGAIFAYGDGSQRLVRRGREVAPGLVLQVVRVQEVILSGNGTNLRLTFSGPAVPMQPTVAPAPATAPIATPAPPTPPPDRSLFR